nr:glycoside hydrolase family 43 protein [uncultured Carboxylicivirga sp.]
MKKNLNIYLVAFFIVAIILSLTNTSCTPPFNSRNVNLDSDSLTAHFDYFRYKGDDDFYKNNPLPGDNYYYNPILPGWYSDPSICTDGENYFMVTSTFSFFPGVPIFHSTDLMNWKQIGHVLDRPEQLPLEGQRTSRGIFAPAISYNPHNKTWYMITTNMQGGNFFVKTQDPFYSWSDPIWLPDVHGIDPSFLFDEDGKAYIVNNDEPDGGSTYEGHRAIRIIEFDVEKDKTVGPSTMLVNGGVNLDEKPIWIEGPHLYNIKGDYYLMCAEGGTSVDHREVIFRGKSPMGPFIAADVNPILTQRHLPRNRELPVTCAGHADLIQDKDGKWWSVFLACRPIENKFENLGRETFLMPVRWSDSGFPYITKGDELIPRIVQMKGVKRDESAFPFGNFEKTDEFDSLKLGTDWLTLRGDASELYSLQTNPGYLSLKSADVASNEVKELAYVCRRLQHHKFECETRLYFEPKSEDEMAGLLLYKDETHQYLMGIKHMSTDSIEIELIKVKEEGSEILAKQAIDKVAGPIDLKITSNGKELSFYFTTDDNWSTLATGIDAYYLSTSQSYGFTGTEVGLYTTSQKDY